MMKIEICAWKTIEYYVKNVYGNDREYVKDADLARQIAMLTGQKTITPSVRGLLQTISGGKIQFKQVLP
jgi:hypothetical protein